MGASLNQSKTLIMALSNLAGLAAGAALLFLAQAEIQIPSDAQLDRMERQGIATPPLYDGDAVGGGIEAENRRMEDQARRIDERLLGGGICRDCK